MPEFLSDDWIAALEAAAPDGIAPFVVEQVVTDVPGRGDVHVHFTFDERQVRARPGAAGRADVTFTTNYQTAVALARGETNAQQALATGRFRIGGDMDALVKRAGALAALSDAFAAVRAATTYR